MRNIMRSTDNNIDLRDTQLLAQTWQQMHCCIHLILSTLHLYMSAKKNQALKILKDYQTNSFILNQGNFCFTQAGISTFEFGLNSYQQVVVYEGC